MSSQNHYRQVLDLSQRMLAAGMAQRWDDLVLLEQQRRVLFEQTAGVAPPASHELISQIQACDAELNDKLEAWMTHVRILLRLDQPRSPKS
jgi:hypothetical protein